jgi:hypothetical protein
MFDGARSPCRNLNPRSRTRRSTVSRSTVEVADFKATSCSGGVKLIIFNEQNYSVLVTLNIVLAIASG